MIRSGKSICIPAPGLVPRRCSATHLFAAPACYYLLEFSPHILEPFLTLPTNSIVAKPLRPESGPARRAYRPRCTLRSTPNARTVRQCALRQVLDVLLPSTTAFQLSASPSTPRQTRTPLPLDSARTRASLRRCFSPDRRSATMADEHGSFPGSTALADLTCTSRRTSGDAPPPLVRRPPFNRRSGR